MKARKTLAESDTEWQGLANRSKCGVNTSSCNYRHFQIELGKLGQDELAGRSSGVLLFFPAESGQDR